MWIRLYFKSKYAFLNILKPKKMQVSRAVSLVNRVTPTEDSIVMSTPTPEDITTRMLLPHSTTTLVTTTSSLTAVPVPTTTVGTVIIIARSCTMDC